MGWYITGTRDAKRDVITVHISECQWIIRNTVLSNDTTLPPPTHPFKYQQGGGWKHSSEWVLWRLCTYVCRNYAECGRQWPRTTKFQGTEQRKFRFIRVTFEILPWCELQLSNCSGCGLSQNYRIKALLLRSLRRCVSGSRFCSIDCYRIVELSLRFV